MVPIANISTVFFRFSAGISATSKSLHLLIPSKQLVQAEREICTGCQEQRAAGSWKEQNLGAPFSSESHQSWSVQR